MIHNCIYQLHKRPSYEFKNIQDKVFVSSDRSVCAISDGTTQSFNSEIWADMLVTDFIKSPEFSPLKLHDRWKDLAFSFKSKPYAFSSNPAKAALERHKLTQGGSATFIGYRTTGAGKTEILTIGDSNVFVLSDDVINGHPFKSVDELDANTSIVNSETVLNDEHFQSKFCYELFEVKQSSILILATDAISRFFLKNPEKIHELLACTNFNQFLDFCMRYWESKELEEDDITAVVLNGMDNQIRHIIPPEGFTFPKDEETQFEPFSAFELNEHDMNNAVDSINRNVAMLEQRLSKSEKKVRLLEIIGLSLFSVFFLTILWVFFRKESTPVRHQQEVTTSPVVIKRDRSNSKVGSEAAQKSDSVEVKSTITADTANPKRKLDR